MASGNAWPFFLFRLKQPEVGSESEPENPYGLSQTISILLSCIHRAVSSCWSSVSLVSSSVIFELACANFSSAFWWWSHSAEALFSAILMSSVKLSWRSLYHSTFLSHSEDASSSRWWTMFGHAIWKAFSTSLDGISTVDNSYALTTCTAYALHISHPSWCVVMINWGIPWMSQVLDLSLTSKIFIAPCSGTLVSLVSISGFIFKATIVACWLFCSTPRCTEMVVRENPWWLLSNHLVLNLFSCVTYDVTAYIRVSHSMWPIIYWACSWHDKSWGALAPCSSRYTSRASGSLQELSSSHVTSPSIHLTCNF